MSGSRKERASQTGREHRAPVNVIAQPLDLASPPCSRILAFVRGLRASCKGRLPCTLFLKSRIYRVRTDFFQLLFRDPPRSSRNNRLWVASESDVGRSLVQGHYRKSDRRPAATSGSRCISIKTLGAAFVDMNSFQWIVPIPIVIDSLKFLPAIKRTPIFDMTGAKEKESESKWFGCLEKRQAGRLTIRVATVADCRQC